MKSGNDTIFRFARQIRQTNQDIIGDKCIKNDSGNISTTDEAKLEAWKEHYERLLNVEFPWDPNHLDQVESIPGAPLFITVDMVSSAVAKMKTGKAAGPSGIIAEMIKAAGEPCLQLISELTNSIISENRIPADWENSFMISLYKGKGDALERGNYRGLKLLDQCLKVIERIVEVIIRDRIEIDKMQFGFMPGRGTTDAIFILRQMQEKFLAKNLSLYFAFVDLEKAFDRVPRKVIWWAMRKLGIEEWIISLVQAMYVNARSQVRVNGSFSDPFDVKVGVHQGSVLSPLLFIIVLEALSREFRTSSPWELLYADDLVIIATSLQELLQKLEHWKNEMEAKGLRVNMPKTKIMISADGTNTLKDSGKYPCAVCRQGVGSNSIQCTQCSFWVHKKCSGIKGRLKPDPSFVCSRCIGTAKPIDSRTVTEVALNDDLLDVVAKFCYLGDMVSQGGGCLESVTTRICCAWKKFRELLPLLTSHFLSLPSKGKMFAIYIRKALLHACECWGPTASDLSRLQRCDRSMIRWICNISWKDNVSSVTLLERLKIPALDSVLTCSRLRWYGHVQRDEGCLHDAFVFEAPGTRGRGRPKKTWFEAVKKDVKSWKMPSSADDRFVWRSKIKDGMQSSNPHLFVENGR